MNDETNLLLKYRTKNELLYKFFFVVENVPSTVDLDPNFNKPIQNVTIAVGREAILSCSVTNLGNYKVRA